MWTAKKRRADEGVALAFARYDGQLHRLQDENHSLCAENKKQQQALAKCEKAARYMEVRLERQQTRHERNGEILEREICALRKETVGARESIRRSRNAVLFERMRSRDEAAVAKKKLVLAPRKLAAAVAAQNSLKQQLKASTQANRSLEKSLAATKHRADAESAKAKSRLDALKGKGVAINTISAEIKTVRLIAKHTAAKAAKAEADRDAAKRQAHTELKKSTKFRQRVFRSKTKARKLEEDNKQKAGVISVLKKSVRIAKSDHAAVIADYASKFDELQARESLLQQLVDSKETLTFLEKGTGRTRFNSAFDVAAMSFLSIEGINPAQVIPCMAAALAMCGMKADRLSGTTKIRELKEELNVLSLAMAAHTLKVERGKEGHTFFVLQHDSGTKGQQNGTLTKDPLIVYQQKTTWNELFTAIESQETVMLGIGNPCDGSAVEEAKEIAKVGQLAYKCLPGVSVTLPDAEASQLIIQSNSVQSDGALNATAVASEIDQMKSTLVPLTEVYSKASQQLKSVLLHTNTEKCGEHDTHNAAKMLLKRLDDQFEAQLLAMGDQTGAAAALSTVHPAHRYSISEGLRTLQKFFGDTSYVWSCARSFADWLSEPETLLILNADGAVAFPDAKERHEWQLAYQAITTGERFLGKMRTTMVRVANYDIELYFLLHVYAGRKKETSANELAKACIVLLQQKCRLPFHKALAIIYADIIAPFMTEIRFKTTKIEAQPIFIEVNDVLEQLVKNPATIPDHVSNQTSLSTGMNWTFIEGAKQGKDVAKDWLSPTRSSRFGKMLAECRSQAGMGTDMAVSSVLVVACISFSDALQHYGEENFPGGAIHPDSIHPLDKLVLLRAQVQVSNKVCESGLGVYDRKIQFRETIGNDNITGDVQMNQNKSFDKFKALSPGQQVVFLENAKDKRGFVKKHYADGVAAKKAFRQTKVAAEIQEQLKKQGRDAEKVLVMEERGNDRIKTVGDLNTAIRNGEPWSSEAKQRRFLIDQIQCYGNRLAPLHAVVKGISGPEGVHLYQQRKDGPFRSNAHLLRDLKTMIGMCTNVTRTAADVNVEGKIDLDEREFPPPPPILAVAAKCYASAAREKKLTTLAAGRKRRKTVHNRVKFRKFAASDNDINAPLSGWHLAVGVENKGLGIKGQTPCWVGKKGGDGCELEIALGVEYCQLKSSLPAGWVPVWEMTVKRWYFWNSAVPGGETVWVKPV
jgi:hypothetical protein